MYHGIIVWCEPLELDGIFITWCFFHVLKYKEKSMSVISANNTFFADRYPTTRIRLEWLRNNDENVRLQVGKLPMAMFTLVKTTTQDCTMTFITGTMQM